MDIPRTEANLLQLIRDQVEESVALDYKRSEALTRTDPNFDLTKEVTKDVSAFANSAGGIIIYGIAEGTGATKHLPVTLSPIDRTKFSKERIEHLIKNIQPRIADIEIVPVKLSSASNDVAYVVVIPASTTAHQCTDKRYYRRYNFESVPMEDYELRDVMNRRSLPKIELEALIEFSVRQLTSGIPGYPIMESGRPKVHPHNTITFTAKNIGGVIAKHVVGFVEMPPQLLKDHEDGGRLQIRNFHPQFTGEYVGGFPRRGNPQWVPILPSLSLQLKDYELPIHLPPNALPDFSIPWIIHCDEAPARSGIFTKGNVRIDVSEEYMEWLNGPRLRKKEE